MSKYYISIGPQEIESKLSYETLNVYLLKIEIYDNIILFSNYFFKYI